MSEPKLISLTLITTRGVIKVASRLTAGPDTVMGRGGGGGGGLGDVTAEKEKVIYISKYEMIKPGVRCRM